MWFLILYFPRIQYRMMKVDGYIEIAFQAGMDLGWLKKAYGDRITLYGNLDCGNKLSFGSPEEVRAHTPRVYRGRVGEGAQLNCPHI